ncbi:YWHAZ, partial [Symbiodinium microadriaticum]
SALRLILYAIPDQPEHCRMVLNIAREKVEGEIEKLCRDVLDLVWDLLRCASSTEYRVYLLKLQGDYTRYLCEMRKGQELRNLIEKAHEYYISATMLGNKCLGTLNQTRLGLALNFSVFFYEVIRDKGRATAIAREAYEAALLEIDMHPERLGRDAALILQLLRDNLIMWEEDSPLSVLNMHRY